MNSNLRFGFAALALAVLPSPVLSAVMSRSIADYGATPDGKKCTEAIRRTIAACAGEGGRVVVPRGTWLTGPVHLRSDVELHLEKDAVLLFSDDPADYLPGVPAVYGGSARTMASPLLYASACTNVAVTGPGTLKVKMDFWWTQVGPNAPRRAIRPHFVQFRHCKNVRMEGFAIRGTPSWTIHCFRCEDVVARDLDVDARGDDGRMINNSDGFDVECSRNVLIERCRFRQGDDALVFKSGRDDLGRRIATPTENVIVRDCTVFRGHNLAAVGSELTGGIRNIRISHCRVAEPVLEVLHIKTNRRRGGFVDNVVVEDIETVDLKEDVFGLTSRYYYGAPGQEALEKDYLTPIRNVTLRNIRCQKVPRMLTLRGDCLLPMDGVTVENVRCAECAEGDYIASVKNLTIDGKTVEPTVRVVTTSELRDADLTSVMYYPEIREYLVAETDGTAFGTVVRASRDLLHWAEPIARLAPEDELANARFSSPRLRREARGWCLDVVANGQRRAYFTPYNFWPFRPESYFSSH